MFWTSSNRLLGGMIKNVNCWSVGNSNDGIWWGQLCLNYLVLELSWNMMCHIPWTNHFGVSVSAMHVPKADQTNWVIFHPREPKLILGQIGLLNRSLYIKYQWFWEKKKQLFQIYYLSLNGYSFIIVIFNFAHNWFKKVIIKIFCQKRKEYLLKYY